MKPIYKNIFLIIIVTVGFVSSNCDRQIGKQLDILAQPEFIETIKQQKCPQYIPVRKLSRAVSREKAALEGRFIIYGKEISLSPPIDWNQDPYHNASWQFYLHTLDHLDVLLARYAEKKDKVALKIAVAHGLDWVAFNRPDKQNLSHYAWSDMASGIRAAYLGYILAAGVCENILSDKEIASLAASVEIHADYLVDPDSYTAGTNHGLFQDQGLYLLAKYAPFFDLAKEWQELAIFRFMRTVLNTVQNQEFVHLEHSPGYHCMIVTVIKYANEVIGFTEELLDTIAAKMIATSGWFVKPDGRLAQFGDTNKSMAPNWAKGASVDKKGLKAFIRSGYAMVKKGGSYLAIHAGFHNRTHKHADEASFVLSEQKRNIIVDSGKWGYQAGKDRDYAISSRAHNVLVVDEQDFDRYHRPYKSGILASGEDEGWYAVLVENPQLEKQKTKHMRYFLYRPDRILLVLDLVAAQKPHSYTRYFHFAPEIELIKSKDGIRFSSEQIAGFMLDFSKTKPKIEIVAGRKEPHMQGWTSPKDLEWQVSKTAIYRTKAKDDLLIAALGLGYPPQDVKVAKSGTQEIEVAINWGDQIEKIVIRTEGQELKIGSKI
jgi:hypothetical protein